jgi:hypothetical protein
MYLLATRLHRSRNNILLNWEDVWDDEARRANMVAQLQQLLEHLQSMVENLQN